jgi:hypothetical protein
MIIEVIALVATPLAAVRPRLRPRREAPPPSAEEYQPDAYRRRRDRFNGPTWLDQRKVLWNVNGIGGRWL